MATLALRASHGFTRLLPSVVVLAGYVIATVLLSVVIRWLPLSVTYAIWAGAGTALVSLIGIVFLGESAAPWRLVSLALIVSGVVGLNLTGAAR